MFPSSVTSHVQRDSLHVYQQDVDLTSELTAYCGLRRKGKLLATHVRLGGGRRTVCTADIFGMLSRKSHRCIGCIPL